MNKDKIQQDIELFEKQKTDLIKQFDEYMSEFGSFIDKKYNLKPNAEKFANWFLDNHQQILRKKRRVPFRLTREYVFQFCSEYKLELDEFEVSQRIDTYVSEDNIYKSKVDKIFEEYIPKMKVNVEPYVFLKLISDISNVLFYEELPKNIDKLSIKEFDAKQESIRYLFYQTYLLNKTKKIKRLVVDYLLKKFDAFSNNEPETLLKKLSTKPQYFDKVK